MMVVTLENNCGHRDRGGRHRGRGERVSLLREGLVRVRKKLRAFKEGCFRTPAYFEYFSEMSFTVK